MALREIIILPDKQLRLVSQPVESVTPEIRQLVDDMFETMYAAPGIGLAAIQVAQPLRLITMDLAKREENGETTAKVRVRFTDLDGKLHEEDAEGLFATCIQHEIDHLNGVLFVDYLSKLKRDRVLKKFEKVAKRAGE